MAHKISNHIGLFREKLYTLRKRVKDMEIKGEDSSYLKREIKSLERSLGEFSEEEVKIKCPHCGEKFEVDLDKLKTK